MIEHTHKIQPLEMLVGMTLGFGTAALVCWGIVVVLDQPDCVLRRKFRSSMAMFFNASRFMKAMSFSVLRRSQVAIRSFAARAFSRES